ncbi:AAA family ATPase [bacterium]|nr:AAA family ATPase [bacterium]
MRILVVDKDEASRALLMSRVEEAIRQVGLKRVDLALGDYSLFSELATTEPCGAIFLGPSLIGEVESAMQLARAGFPSVPLALVLDNEVYAERAVELRRLLPIRLIAIADIPQMAAFLLDSETELNTLPGNKNRGVVAVTQLKGGVGCSTVAAALASCWARHGLSTALVDLDDVNPQLSDWARANTSQRLAVSELLRQGEVSKQRINDLVSPVDGYDGKLVVVPQPELYRESFHFKADVLEHAPSAVNFVKTLISLLREEFDVVVVDVGRSWGVASFAMLPISQHILLVMDDDGMSVRRSIDNLQRLVKESDDAEEFDLSRWSVVLNAVTGKLLTAKDVATELQELELFPETSNLYTMPFSETGRQWGAPGQSYFDLAEPQGRQAVQHIAFSIIPFRQELVIEQPLEKLIKGVQKLTGQTLFGQKLASFVGAPARSSESVKK